MEVSEKAKRTLLQTWIESKGKGRMVSDCDVLVKQAYQRVCCLKRELTDSTGSGNVTLPCLGPLITRDFGFLG